jgi:phosphohistidine phosphatase SixA
MLYLLLAGGAPSRAFGDGTDAKQTADPGCSGLKDATVLIIRHAEKPEAGRDLTAKGRERAEAYAKYFRELKIDSKPVALDYLVATADSASSERPRLTLEPLSKALGMKLDLRFKAKEDAKLAAELRAKPHGKNILICWHHGKIPDLAKALGADPAKLLPNGTWPDAEFGWILVLRYDGDGRLLPEQTKRINGVQLLHQSGVRRDHWVWVRYRRPVVVWTTA